MSYDQCKKILFEIIPKQELVKVFETNCCEYDLDFVGFIEEYFYLSKILPKHYTIIDLGCGGALQSYYFKDFKQYIGVDIGSIGKRVYPPKNTLYYQKDIESFINNDIRDLDLNTCFAICNYVPDNESVEIARNTFKNIFVYYPCGKFQKVDNHPKIFFDVTEPGGIRKYISIQL